MNPRPFILIAFASLLLCLAGACVSVDDAAPEAPGQRKVNFDISVSRDGQLLGRGRSQTKGELVDAEDLLATMDTHRPFGLIGIEKGTNSVLIDNTPVYSNNAEYSGMFNALLWELPSTVQFSAYYPYVRGVEIESGQNTYSIPFSATETEAGPLVSKTVERAIDQLNTLPLDFHHITNDIGFKICDATPREELQGLIHLRRLTATNVASAGVYVNDMAVNRGNWNYQGYYRSVVVFQGDALLGVGTEEELFVGDSQLVSAKADSHRYYAIPDDLVMGKQCVEVVFDVDGFTLGEEPYAPLKDQVYKYMLYGLLPNNTFVPGKQYTFHIGVDLSSIYPEITFAPSVGDWETKIYENNEDF